MNVGVLIDPAGVKLCVCVPIASPVKVGAVTVPAGVKLCVWVASALPVNVGCVTVPVSTAGVPLNVCAATVPALPVNVCADTVPALPVNAGTPAGHAIEPLLLTLCVSDADGPAVVPLATPPVGFAVLPLNVAASVLVAPVVPAIEALVAVLPEDALVGIVEASVPAGCV